LSALDAARDAAGDTEVAERLARAREAVARGERLTQSLERERALAPIALQLVGVGESSGDLGAMVSRAGDLTSERTARSLRGMVNLLEPALVILMGLLVALTAGALLQAVYSVRPGV
jgi:type II secretory pathway component PulF